MGEGGVVDVVGSFAYCDQRPWILNATIENNILFGSPLEQQRFDDAIRVSCLADDLKVMPSGIQTEIGNSNIFAFVLCIVSYYIRWIEYF